MFPEVNYPKTTQKRHNFACDNYIFPKTRGNKNKERTHSTPINVSIRSHLLLKWKDIISLS